MEFHNNVTQQAVWDELVHKLSSWKNLAFAYLKSIKDGEPYSEELFNAMKSANCECHMVLDKILKWILTNSTSPDNGEIVELLSQEFIGSLFPHQRFSESLDRQLLITPNVCRIGKPQYGSAFLSIDQRSDIKINYETKTNHRILLFENLNKDPPNSNVPIQSKHLNSSSCYSPTLSPSEDIDLRTFTSHNPTQCAVRNTLQYTDQDQQNYDNRYTHSFVSRHQQQSMSPTNNYHETQYSNKNRSRSRSCNEQRWEFKSTDSLENHHKPYHGNRNRSRSRSYYEQRYKSKSTDSFKKKQELRERTRFSRTKSPKWKENVSKYKQELRDRMRKKCRSKSPKWKENLTKYKQESRDRMRKKSRSKSRTKSPKRKENVSKDLPLSKQNSDPPPLPSNSDIKLNLEKKPTMRRNNKLKRLQEELSNLKEKMIESNPDDEVPEYHPRTPVFVIRPPPPFFMPPRPRLLFPPRLLPRLPPPMMFRPQWHP